MPKAMAAGSPAADHFRLRYDVADGKGAITLCRAGSSLRSVAARRAIHRRDIRRHDGQS